MPKKQKMCIFSAKKYAYYKFAIEVRHESWLSKESMNLMKEYKIAFVIAQSGVNFPYAEYVTAQNIYVRFHGPKELYASSYSTQQLLYFANNLKHGSAADTLCGHFSITMQVAMQLKMPESL